MTTATAQPVDASVFDLSPAELYSRYRKNLCKVPGLNMTLDISRMPFGKSFFRVMEPAMQHAYAEMEKLESGAIANPDENRMVGHYWLRAPGLAPEPDLTKAIHDTVEDIKAFVDAVHTKAVKPATAAKFTDVLSIGIGGSALGPQFLADALGGIKRKDKIKVHFIDNTDTDGIRRTLDGLGAKMKSTLVLVISKSGGTPEPRNGMIEAKAAFEAKGLDFAKHAVAITGDGSQLDGVAKGEGWLKIFPMWDWVGGRTSVMATVGLVPLALQGIKIDDFLAGAQKMDEITRKTFTKKNPAALLALMWHLATNGKGEKDMVMLPYKDRLLLLSRYLQQLVMESLGKEYDLDGNPVYQGIAVYGNKGSTDQHAYVQQLREGVNNFFATFIVGLQDTTTPGKNVIEVEDGVTAGDYLSGFFQGTRTALFENGRGSMTITCDKIDAKTVGALIALYERAVGFYATLVNINAYHQPGVEAGKKAAATVLEVQAKAVAALTATPQNPVQIAEAIGDADAVETIDLTLAHLAANKRIGKKGAGYLAN
ncbi:glucose-6-phosphate isomerase [Algisphaera agarilytica]|uniref:Glucose-6-phosphate isomerase n=1 Tax=Algisphaera agarilytica TaxID=1385975 RepID=A0A7X0LLN8_9BACT|nr:glucose-6-phosphate isomerase [Algisphaera agarilytica]MBB6430831.1 glucose-6-phosphate isomerase [Algisphaera agarilytica]